MFYTRLKSVFKTLTKNDNSKSKSKKVQRRHRSSNSDKSKSKKVNSQLRNFTLVQFLISKLKTALKYRFQLPSESLHISAVFNFKVKNCTLVKLSIFNLQARVQNNVLI